MAKKLRCPGIFCRSKDCIPLAVNQNFKVGKGIVNSFAGDLIFGPGGALVGLASGFNGKRKVTFKCMKCGRVFTDKV